MAIVKRRLLLLIACFAAALPLFGIVRRHDRDDARYVGLAQNVKGVVDMNLPGGAGTLVAPEWVLTAAHVVQLIDLPHDVIVEGQRVAIRDIVAYPGGGAGRDDLALVRLARVVNGVAPLALDEGDATAGMEILVAGRGFAGDGLRGPVERDRRLRAAKNRIERVLAKWLVFRFDAPPGALDLEGISGPGDSGGPALIEVDGKHVIAGVSSGQNDYGKGEGRYGADEYYVRVCAYAEWIAEMMRE
jgi:hypothetical protein